jgi:hypothetical protein
VCAPLQQSATPLHTRCNNPTQATRNLIPWTPQPTILDLEPQALNPEPGILLKPPQLPVQTHHTLRVRKPTALSSATSSTDSCVLLPLLASTHASSCSCTGAPDIPRNSATNQSLLLLLLVLPLLGPEAVLTIPGCRGSVVRVKVRWNQCRSFGSQDFAKGSSDCAAAEAVSSRSKGSWDARRAWCGETERAEAGAHGANVEVWLVGGAEGGARAYLSGWQGQGTRAVTAWLCGLLLPACCPCICNQCCIEAAATNCCN